MAKESLLLMYLIIAALGLTYSVPESRLRRHLAKSSKGKGYSYTSDDGSTLPPLEEAMEPSGSNDSTHLEHICSLFAEFGNVAPSTNLGDGCDNFERYAHIMCPDEHEIQKICTSASLLELNDASMNEYCLPLFKSLIGFPEEAMICADLCFTFIAEAECCKFSCP